MGTTGPFHFSTYIKAAGARRLRGDYAARDGEISGGFYYIACATSSAPLHFLLFAGFIMALVCVYERLEPRGRARAALSAA